MIQLINCHRVHIQGSCRGVILGQECFISLMRRCDVSHCRLFVVRRRETYLYFGEVSDIESHLVGLRRYRRNGGYVRMQLSRTFILMVAAQGLVVNHKSSK